MTINAPYEVRKAATELAVELFDCDWCIAKAGELCYPEPSSAEASAGFGHGWRDWTRTHLSRFAGHGQPEEFLAAHGRTVPREAVTP